MYLLNPILGKDWIVRVGACCIRPTNAHDHGQMIDPPDTCRGVCNTPIPIRIKNLIPIYWINLKPGGFWGVCLCDQPRPGEKLLKFVWMHAKPGGDWMKMAIFTENPARIGRKWPYSPKTRRGLDENGHIYQKPGGDWMNMAISTENSPGIGFNMDAAIESFPRIGFHTFSGITFLSRMGFMSPHAGYTYSI